MDLNYQDVLVSIRVLNAIANVSKAIDTNDPDLVYRHLSRPDVHLTVNIKKIIYE